MLAIMCSLHLSKNFFGLSFNDPFETLKVLFSFKIDNVFSFGEATNESYKKVLLLIFIDLLIRRK